MEHAQGRPSACLRGHKEEVMADRIKELQDKRFQFLRKVYDRTAADLEKYESAWEIGDQLGLSHKEAEVIADHLEKEGKIEALSVMSAGDRLIRVSHLGVVSVEEALSKPQGEAEHPPSSGAIPQSRQVARAQAVGSPVRSEQPDPTKVFVVHGRNEAARRAMFSFLRAIGLKPIEWTEAVSLTGKGSPYIGEILDQAFGVAQAVVVLITGDDVARLGTRYLAPDDPEHERTLTPQARPNVLFEAGLAFGRNPARTVLVVLGTSRPFSDIAGRHIIQMSDKLHDRQALAVRLKTAGCSVDFENHTDWHKEGSFDLAIVPPDEANSSNPREIVTTVAVANLESRAHITPEQRRTLTEKERNSLLDALHSALPSLVVEALKDLERDVYRLAIEQDSSVMAALIRIPERDRGEQAARALGVIRTLLLTVADSENSEWAGKSRSVCLQMCLEQPSVQIANTLFQALRCLAVHPVESDLNHIAYCIGKWPEEVYQVANPLDWLKAMKNRGFRSDVTEMLRNLLVGNPGPEIERRVREAMGYLRSN